MTWLIFVAFTTIIGILVYVFCIPAKKKEVIVKRDEKEIRIDAQKSKLGIKGCDRPITISLRMVKSP